MCDALRDLVCDISLLFKKEICSSDMSYGHTLKMEILQ